MTPAKFAKLVEQLERAEGDMRRAIKRWEKYRGQVKRAAKTLDREFAKRGEGDVRDVLGVEYTTPELRAGAAAPFDDELPDPM